MRHPDLRLPTKLWTRIGAAALAVALVAGLAFAGVRHFTALPDDAALSYDGTVVTQAQLTERVDLLGALYGVKKPKGKKDQNTFRRDVAKAVAVSMILDKAAAERDIVISDKSARDTLAAMVKGQLGADPDAAFTKLLGEFGVSENDVLAEIKRQEAIARLFKDVTEDAVVGASDGDVRAYFDKDPAKFAVPEQRDLRNIVLASRQDATAVLARARRGEDFGVLARKTSLDDATRAKSGELGTVTAAQLDPTFAQTAFAARAGGLFGPVKSQYGWNVGMVRKVVPGQNAVFASVQDQVTDAVRSERGLASWRKWLARQIKTADVEYADKYLPAHPDDAPADASTPSTRSPATGSGTVAGQ
jgi:peptidyl-prolyl cis-trans isomerase C